MNLDSEALTRLKPRLEDGGIGPIIAYSRQSRHDPIGKFPILPIFYERRGLGLRTIGNWDPSNASIESTDHAEKLPPGEAVIRDGRADESTRAGHEIAISSRSR